MRILPRLVVLVGLWMGMSDVSAAQDQHPKQQQQRQLQRQLLMNATSSLWTTHTTTNYSNDNTDSITPRIVGGTLADPGTYPWYVSPTGSFFCGGSLIHPDVVLTAAHCDLAYVVNEPVTIGGVVRGSTAGGAVARTITRLVPHPNYDEATVANDFMLVKLDAPVNNVPLITLNNNPNTPAEGQVLSVMGYGLLQDGGSVTLQLNEVDLLAIAHNDCRRAYQGITPIIENIMLCAGGIPNRGSCQGDSGGPIVTADGVQVGVVSFGVDCGVVEFPDVYARVSGAYDWIQTTLCALSDVRPADCPDDITSFPTLAPTLETGGAPPPAVDTGKHFVKFIVQYDAAPAETSWLISQQGRILYRGPVDYTPAPGEKWATEFPEFPAGEFGFTVRDAAGNGLAAGPTRGFFQIWQVLRDGTEVLLAAGDDDFWYSTSVRFTVDPDGGAGVTLAPTMDPQGPVTLCTCDFNTDTADCDPRVCQAFDNDRGACEATGGCIFTSSAPIQPDDSGDGNGDSFLQSWGFYIVLVVAVIGVVFLGVVGWQRYAAARTGPNENRNSTSRGSKARQGSSRKSSSRSNGQGRPNMSSWQFAGNGTAATTNTFSTGGGIDDDGLAYEDV